MGFSVLRKELISERTRENASAHQNPSTKNPGTMADATKTSTAFITKVNIPKVIIFIGSVRITRIGLINVLNTPITTAITTAVKKFLMSTPGRR